MTSAGLLCIVELAVEELDRAHHHAVTLDARSRQHYRRDLRCRAGERRQRVAIELREQADLAREALAVGVEAKHLERHVAGLAITSAPHDAHRSRARAGEKLEANRHDVSAFHGRRPSVARGPAARPELHAKGRRVSVRARRRLDMQMRLFFGASAVLVLTLGACGSDSSSDTTPKTCVSDPSSCGAGKTCWVVDVNGKFDCLDAPSAQVEGSPCQNTLGQAQCAAGLSCFPSSSGSQFGTCSPFCSLASPNGTCTNGGLCTQLTLVSAPSAPHAYVCSPGAGGAGGAGGNAGSASGGAAGTAATGGAAGTTASGGVAGVAASAGADAG
jgi:hypothetical protein